MKIINLLWALIVALIIAPFVALYRALANPPDGLCVSNTAGPAGGYDGGIISRIASTAFTVPNLVAGVGTTAGVNAAPCAATGVVPLGFCEETAILNERIAVNMGYGKAVIGVAAAAIAPDVPVYTAAAGQLSSTGGTGKYLMGRSASGADAQGDEFTVIPCPPVLQA